MKLLLLTACIVVAVSFGDALRIALPPVCKKPTPFGCDKVKVCQKKRCFPGQKCNLVCGTCKPICTGLCQPCQLAKCSVGYRCVADFRKCTARCCKNKCDILTVCKNKVCPLGQVASPDLCSCKCECKKAPCLRPCPKIYRPVCGTDGVTYANDCLLAIATCRTNGRIRKRNNGRCVVNKFCPVKNPCSGIKCGGSKICVPDFKACAYSCQPNICPNINCLVPACFSKPCGKTEKCLSVCPSGCVSACLKSRCIRGCPRIYRPVCGTDGKTYSNSCILKIATCKSNGKIRQKHTGRCCSKICPKILRPVCGTDGKTYGNDCLLRYATCKSNGKIKLKHRGRCCSKICPKIYRPVCGTDGKTYGNDCLLQYATCKSNGKIKLKHRGRCCQRICPAIYKPVCGTDGKTYGNSCLLSIATCKSKGKIQLKHNGPCRKCPDVCITLYDPVCGSDGKTYSNSCFLGIASCKSGGKIKQVGKGRCGASH